MNSFHFVSAESPPSVTPRGPPQGFPSKAEVAMAKMVTERMAEKQRR